MDILAKAALRKIASQYKTAGFLWETDYDRELRKRRIKVALMAALAAGGVGAGIYGLYRYNKNHPIEVNPKWFDESGNFVGTEKNLAEFAEAGHKAGLR